MSPHESDILKPKDPTLTNDNDWPEFLLTNARVYHGTTGEIVPLLHADEHAPVNITGKLEGVDKSQLHLLLKPSYSRAVPLEITDVDRYSYGIYDDGQIDIWAAGLAGYYKIRPSRAYKPIYQGMIEAVKILYFIADMHRGQSGRAKKREKMAPSPKKIFTEYCHATVTCADVEDAANTIYKHRHWLFTCMALGKEGIDWERTPFYKHMAERFPAGFEAAQPQNRRLKRKRNAKLKEDSVEAERLSSMDRETGNETSTANPAQSGRRGRPLRNERLLGQSTTPLQPVKSIKSDIDNSGDDSDAPIDRRMAQKGRGKGKSKSALRPKTTTINALRGDSDDEMSESPMPLPKRKNPEVLERQPPKRVLRNNPQLGFDGDEAIDMPSDDDEVEMADINQASFEANKSAALPLRWKSDPLAGGGPTRPPFTIVTEQRPSMIAQGPGDVWTCTYDGCLRRVYGASKGPGKGLIEEHLKMHSEQSEERVELVKREGELAAGLPVGYGQPP
ncbi:MAG: hypothetical protein Q9165_000933 [Trypethelium subeluteriae]